MIDVPENVSLLRAKFGGTWEIRKPDPDIHRDLKRGWLLQYLLDFDDLTWRRWDYWFKLRIQDEIPGEKAMPSEPIPPIEYIGEGGTESHNGARYASQSAGFARTRKMLEASLEAISSSWQGWSSPEYIGYFLDWLLFGFGYTQDPPKEPLEGASDRLYQVFNIGPLLLWPHDYLGDILAEMNIGKHAGFYPTPHNVVQCMTMMTFDEDQDHRLDSTLDPCVGTGRMLLYAGNHSLYLAGQDINPLMVKCTLVNGFLYVPWLVRPIEWIQEASRARHDEQPALDEPELELGPEPVMPDQVSRAMRRKILKGQGILL